MGAEVYTCILSGELTEADVLQAPLGEVNVKQSTRMRTKSERRGERMVLQCGPCLPQFDALVCMWST